MIFRKLTYNLFKLSTFVLLLACVQACTDDDLPGVPDYTRVGEPVTLSVKVSLPEMDKKSRAELPFSEINRVVSLWVRTYSATGSGKATSEWKKIELSPNTTITEADNDFDMDITTLSGYNYIIGVANPEVNYGVTKDKPYPDQKKLLSELLENNADTWQDFLNIAVMSPYSLRETYAPVPPLPMSGCYVDIVPGGQHPTVLGEWEKSNFTPFFIPASKDKVVFENGAIHLRRLVSQINFVFKPKEGADVDVTVNSYTLYNVPMFNWLYERRKTDVCTNVGDAATGSDNGKDYYVGGLHFGAQYITRNTDGSSSFNYWQGENKHTSTNLTDYKERAKQKDDYNGEGLLFTSLSGDTWTPNNMASYVRVQCTVAYNGSLNVDEQGNVVTKNGKVVTRVGHADYIIQLGYIKDSKGFQDPNDFNCYRNTKYTYNVTVGGVDDIRVDANANEEQYHGEEGLVIDMDNVAIDLDCHYHAYNIELTHDELTAGYFGYLFTVYEGGQQHNIDETNKKNSPSLYYDWVELRPTNDKNTLAEYKPYTGANADGNTFRLCDLNNNDGKSAWDNLTSNQRSKSGWYTIFINENVYETSSDESGTNWKKYTNQPARRCYIRVTRSTSPDGKSIYSRAKYGLEQRSIQSYYSSESTASTAVGLEAVNETEGLNMRNSFTNTTAKHNGRYNMSVWLGSYKKWNRYIVQSEPLHVPAVTGNRAQGGPKIEARYWEMPRPANINNYSSINSADAVFNDPQNLSFNYYNSTNAKYYLEVMNACLNRNRDNNGDGNIDNDEIRWYVPNIQKYIRIMLGSKSLINPLIDFSVIKDPPPAENKSSWSGTTVVNDCLTRYHVAASDVVNSEDGVSVLWAFEGLSTSSYKNVYNWGGGYPWQIRCIRNLGTNLNIIDNSNVDVVKAYEIDKTNRTVKMTHYDISSIRPAIYSGNGNGLGKMPLHVVTSQYNLAYDSFEYKPDSVDIEISSTYWGSLNQIDNFINTDPCYNKFGGDWRIPNQRELAILMNEDELKTQNIIWLSCTYSYFDMQGNGPTYKDGSSRFLGMMNNKGLLLTWANMNSYGYVGRVRCVRDIR